MSVIHERWEHWAFLYRQCGWTAPTKERTRETDRTTQSEVDRRLVLNSRVLVIIREPQQPLLNYRSHQCDWMRFGHCNAILIIYRLYYYSNNCMVGVIVSLTSPFYFLMPKKKKSVVLHLAKAPIKGRIWLPVVCDNDVKYPLCCCD